MELFLQPHTYVAAHGRDLILFDVEAGRYDLLAGAGDDVVVHPSARVIRLDEGDLAEALAPLSVAPDAFQATLDLPRRPTRSVLIDDVPLSARDRLSFLVATIDMIATYHGRHLPALFQRLAARPETGDSSQTDPVRVSRAFHQLSPWAPFAGDCVYRCYMLLRALQRRGVHDVRWVFAVRTWPFYAHCWLQRGSETLTDYAEPLVSFTPIFAL